MIRGKETRNEINPCTDRLVTGCCHDDILVELAEGHEVRRNRRNIGGMVEHGDIGDVTVVLVNRLRVSIETSRNSCQPVSGRSHWQYGEIQDQEITLAADAEFAGTTIEVNLVAVRGQIPRDDIGRGQRGMATEID